MRSARGSTEGLVGELPSRVAGDGRGDQIGLVLEAAVDRGPGHAGLAGDALHRHPGIAELGQLAQGRLGDGLRGALVAGPAPAAGAAEPTRRGRQPLTAPPPRAAPGAARQGRSWARSRARGPGRRRRSNPSAATTTPMIMRWSKVLAKADLVGVEQGVAGRGRGDGGRRLAHPAPGDRTFQGGPAVGEDLPAVGGGAEPGDGLALDLALEHRPQPGDARWRCRPGGRCCWPPTPCRCARAGRR